MQKPSASAAEMNELIKLAIEKHEITHSEYDRIMMIADKDGVLDPQEKKALADLRDMIEDKTIRIVRDKE
ncbi:MAG: tRNA lysidine(34) synthetase TilS C-terminal domain-containing protein [Spirochaetota bacterium]